MDRNFRVERVNLDYAYSPLRKFKNLNFTEINTFRKGPVLASYRD